MKKNHFISQLRFCGIALLGAGALMLSSCAADGFDDETYISNVQNTQVVSPDVADIKVVSSIDGKTQTFTWPVVKGAGGYLVSLFNESVADAPVAIVTDSIIDGCSVTLDREEDTNYLLTILALGNKNANNTDAAEAAQFRFTTFLPASATLPTGTDLYEYFTANPLPTEYNPDTTIVIDLAFNGEYTLSGPINFFGNKTLIRTATKNMPENAIIVFKNKSTIKFGGGFTMKNVNIDGAETTDPIIQCSDTLNEAIKGTGDHYIITDPVTIMNCYVNNVTRKFLYDGKQKYCIQTFTVDNSVFKFTTDTGASGAAYFEMYDGGGFINDFILLNSTFWNATENSAKYLVRYSNGGRCDRAGFTKNNTNINNCTFYNIAKTGQMANRAGLNGKKTSAYDVNNNIFVDCGGNQVARRLVGSVGDIKITIFNNNTYWFDGAAETGNTSFDTGYQLVSDPAFVDAANGNFTPTGAEQVSMKTVDPRWFETAE